MIEGVIFDGSFIIILVWRVNEQVGAIWLVNIFIHAEFGYLDLFWKSEKFFDKVNTSGIGKLKNVIKSLDFM